MKYEIIKKKETGYSVAVAASRVTSFRKNFNETTTVRVYENGCIGIAGAVGKADIEALKNEAAENLKKGIAYPCSLEGGKVRKDAPKGEIVPADRIVPVFEELLSELAQKAPGYLFGNKINLSYETHTYTNSEGTMYEANGAELVFALTIKDKKSANLMDMVYGKRAFAYDREAVVNEILEMLRAYEDRVPMPQKALPVVVDLGMFSPLLGDFVAEMYGSGAGRMAGKMGQKVFHERLNVLIDREPPYTDRFFDAEGVVNEGGKFYLVKDGVFCGALTTKRSAQLFSLPVSGAAGSTYDGVPGVVFTGLRFEKAAEIRDRLRAIEPRRGGRVHLRFAGGGRRYDDDGRSRHPRVAGVSHEGRKVRRQAPRAHALGQRVRCFGQGLRGRDRACGRRPAPRGALRRAEGVTPPQKEKDKKDKTAAGAEFCVRRGFLVCKAEMLAALTRVLRDRTRTPARLRTGRSWRCRASCTRGRRPNRCRIPRICMPATRGANSA